MSIMDIPIVAIKNNNDDDKDNDDDEEGIRGRHQLMGQSQRGAAPLPAHVCTTLAFFDNHPQHDDDDDDGDACDDDNDDQPVHLHFDDDDDQPREVVVNAKVINK